MDLLEDIIQELKRGKHDRFETIINQYQQQIFKYIFHMLKDTHEAEDVVQEVFFKAFKNIHTYKESISFSAWLYKIAYNHTMNLLKRKKLQKILSIMDYSRLNGKDQSKDNTYIGNGFSYSVDSALSRLTAEERNLMFLRILEERPYEELAIILNQKPSTIRKRLERCKKKFRKYYKGYERREIYEGC